MSTFSSTAGRLKKRKNRNENKKDKNNPKKDKKFRSLLLRLLGIRKHWFSGSVVALLGEELHKSQIPLSEKKLNKKT